MNNELQLTKWYAIRVFANACTLLALCLAYTWNDQRVLSSYT